MPDIQIPVDTSAFNTFFYSLRGSGILREFLFENILREKHPTSMQKILAEFNLSDERFKELLAFAAKNGIKASGKAAAIARDAITTEIKASLARFYFGEEAYYKVINASDKAIARSLQELK